MFEHDSIVIDIGSSSCKFGFTDGEDPKILSTLVGYPREPSPNANVIGNEAQKKRDILNLNRPVEHGVITNWDDMEKIWHHIYHEELKADPEIHPILLCDAIVNTKSNRERMLEVAFETFGAPAAAAIIQPLLSLYGSGRTSGVVIESGSEITQIVATIDGLHLMENNQCLYAAGRHVTSHLNGLLEDKGYNLPSYCVDEIKEKLCYISNGDVSPGEDFKLPDGQTIFLDNERFRAPELLFQLNIQKMVHNCIEDSKEEDDDLYKNIVLSGGNTMLQGFQERISREITALLPRFTFVKVEACPSRKNLAWHGGSTVASLSTFHQFCVFRAEYDEHGPEFIHNKVKLNK